MKKNLKQLVMVLILAIMIFPASVRAEGNNCFGDDLKGADQEAFSTLIDEIQCIKEAHPEFNDERILEIIDQNHTTLITGYIISREYTDDTLKNIITIPVSFQKILAGKLIISGILSVFLGAVCFAFTVVANFIMGYGGFSISAAFTGLLQMSLLVIDAETILDNHIELSKQNSREIINEKIRDSVLFSGLLPNYRFSNKGKGIDMSAIMGKEGDEYPILIPRIAEIGTSNMHYEYVHPIKTANNNLATLNGKFIAPATFIKEIDQGFRDAYRFIMEHKQSTIEKMKIFENIIVRHLIQDTQRYSMILHTSYHPDFLQDGKDRELVLCSIMGHIDEVEKSNKVAELEIKDMLHMDVPYFYINTSCNSLFGTDNKEISNYFETSSICKVKEKICGMTIGAMEEQSRFLKIALTDLNDYKITRKNGNIIRNNISGTFDMRRKQDAIERLAENLLHDAVITPDKHDVNWIGVSSVGSDENSTWQIQPLGNYLYEGLAGIAIFFHALCQSLKIEKYKFVCDALDQNLFTYTKEMEQKVEGIENESSGILCGEAALVYTYEILYQITKHKIYLEYARRHCEILKKTIDNDMYYDLVYGNAGAILALLNLYDLTGEEEYLRIADLAGEKLFASQQFEENTRKGWLGAGSKYPLAGFSHGVAGIAYSLVKLWSYTQKEKYLQAVVASIRFENSLYDDKIGNWKDEREYNGHKSSEQNIYMTAWCHGAAGILLSRCKIMQFDIDKELQDELNKDIKTALATV